MKHLLLFAFALCVCLSSTRAQVADFGGSQQSDRVAQYSERYTDLNYAGDDKAYHTLDVYLPRQRSAHGYPVVIHIYGSAWYSNSSKGNADIHTICAALLDAGYAVVVPNHRSSGDAKFPAQIHDIKAVVRWVRGNASQYHFDTSFVGISGFSSGAHLASLCAATNGVQTGRSGAASYDIEGGIGQYTAESSRVDACCEWSGPIDLMNMDCAGPRNMPHSPEEALMGFTYEGHEDEYRLLSPLYYVGPTMVPILVMHGMKDNVVPQCQAVEFVKALRALGAQGYAYHYEADGGHGVHMYSKQNLSRMVKHFNKAKRWANAPVF